MFLFLNALISYATASRVAKSQRQQQYNFALIEKRFKVNQKCYELAEEMAAVYCNKDKKSDVLKTAKKWLHQNSLYLNPSVREKFKAVMKELRNYENKMELALNASRQSGPDPYKASAESEVLNEAFKLIQGALKAELESEVDGDFWKRMK